MAKQLPPLDKLTKAQRKSIYKKVLKAACEDPSVAYGFCRYFKIVLCKLGYGTFIYCTHIYKSFPEFYKLKPNDGPYWWPLTLKGWEKRIKLFHNMIETM